MAGREGERFCTSFAQQRLWFLDKYEPGTGLYNIAAAWRIQGLLNRDVLEQSLNEIVRRHEALRTAFDAKDEMPVQVIAEHVPLSLEVTDLSIHVDAEQLAQRVIREEA